MKEERDGEMRTFVGKVFCLSGWLCVCSVCQAGYVCVLFVSLAVCVFCLSGWLCVCSVYQAGCVCFLFARLEENYEIADGVCIPRSTLYYHYLHFCEANDTQPVNAASFGKVNLVTGTGKPGHRDR